MCCLIILIVLLLKNILIFTSSGSISENLWDELDRKIKILIISRSQFLEQIIRWMLNEKTVGHVLRH